MGMAQVIEHEKISMWEEGRRIFHVEATPLNVQLYKIAGLDDYLYSKVPVVDGLKDPTAIVALLPGEEQASFFVKAARKVERHR